MISIYLIRKSFVSDSGSSIPGPCDSAIAHRPSVRAAAPRHTARSEASRSSLRVQYPAVTSVEQTESKRARGVALRMTMGDLDKRLPGIGPSFPYGVHVSIRMGGWVCADLAYVGTRIRTVGSLVALMEPWACPRRVGIMTRGLHIMPTFQGSSALHPTWV